MKLSCFGKTVWQNNFTNNFMHGWEREIRERAGISFFFSFIPTHVFVRGEEKQLYPWSCFENGCLTNKTAHNSAVPNRPEATDHNSQALLQEISKPCCQQFILKSFSHWGAKELNRVLKAMNQRSIENKHIQIREMEDNISESIPDPAHFFRSHLAYQ